MRGIKKVNKKELLSSLPSVDEIIKSPVGAKWLEDYPRKHVVAAVREIIDIRRKEIIGGTTVNASMEDMMPDIGIKLRRLSSRSLVPVINATGIIIHTNLGRAVLSKKIADSAFRTAAGYCNLEYDLGAGRRGERHAHVKRLLQDITGAEDGLAVNNNAAAVLLCLNALAKGREVIVSRGELVEIGGSFRIPDVMTESGAILREVGTTNKTRLRDYKEAINDCTALILKVHKSNYRITGFTEEAAIEGLAGLGRDMGIPVVHDLGSGCLIDLKPYGIHTEPRVQEIVKSGADLITFSGDKLLGGPQAGIILGKKNFIKKIQDNPLARPLRIDKLTLAALEAVLIEYLDEEKAKKNIPTIKMLTEEKGSIMTRAKKMAAPLRRDIKNALIEIKEEFSLAGGGSLPDIMFPTYVVSVKPEGISVNELEERLRRGEPPVISRIRGDSLLLDARTVSPHEIPPLIKGVKAALGQGNLPQY